jgi:hypothetical protein
MLREPVLINAEIDESDSTMAWHSVGAAAFNGVAQDVIGLDRRALRKSRYIRRQGPGAS